MLGRREKKSGHRGPLLQAEQHWVTLPLTGRSALPGRDLLGHHPLDAAKASRPASTLQKGLAAARPAAPAVRRPDVQPLPFLDAGPEVSSLLASQPAGQGVVPLQT